MKPTSLLMAASLIACPAFTLAQPTATAAETAQSIQHPWKGKKVGYIGDSITDPNCLTNVKRYWSFLQDWLGITPWVYGVNGREWNDVPRQAEALKKEHGNEVDAVVVLIGTNDFNAGVPIGSWYTEKEEQVATGLGSAQRMETRKHRTPALTDDTFKGRINKGLGQLKALFPDKQIVLLTPLHRAFATFGDTNVQPDESYQNRCGEYFDAYVQAIKEAGNVWGVPVIDLNAASGLSPMMQEHIAYFCNPETDRLHPNTEGHKRIARTLMYQLLALPCAF